MVGCNRPNEPALRRFRLTERDAGWGGYMTALIVGLVSIAAIWLVVIYGSIYLNKNVQ
jgi:hypothetical protein